MIVVKIELWSGITCAKSEIGRMYLANDGTGTRDRGDYKAWVCRRGSTEVLELHGAGPKAARLGEVKNYPRLAYNVWRLISRAIRSAFPEEK